MSRSQLQFRPVLPSPAMRKRKACQESGRKLGSLPAMLRLTRSLAGPCSDSAAQKRRMVAEFCKLLGAQAGHALPSACNDPGLPPRMRQTLQYLLEGDSEKQVAAKLRISRNTVHVYVKALYRRFQVSSRGELLAKCLRGGTGPGAMPALRWADRGNPGSGTGV